MNTIEEQIGNFADWANKLCNAPAVLLVMLSCIVVGYMLRCWKRFPNDGIPLVVILWGGIVLPIIGDDANKLPLRVWLVRNVLIGLIAGLVAWLLHNKVLSKIEAKLGLFSDAPEKSTPPTP